MCLAVSSIAVAGTDAGQFSVTPGSCGSLTPTLAPSGSCTVNVAFSPTADGARSAALRITLNSASHPVLDLPLRGTGFRYG
ncbi:choice-of-anchor D domain-containing protein [Geotalea uraniireducens]|uniref:choice-of-anchor D domain-containing protein n=1 Tax=Geotalea uraniireducens TaxID=351604 RepID=UPI000A0561EF